ncbi:MAG: N-acetylmuramoyl-L-alanine amidase [Deltaproteobacteria bacterium]|nr:N-acetylmuramoyl-L-alanine amidase [Deltaproteobacteria bacterium]MBW2658772.1 N-acetylmuramoyl-L-alanine amidase [Deltaproteobacteria bacterium]
MSQRLTNYSLFLTLIVLLVGFSSPLRAQIEVHEQVPTIKERYDQAKFYFNQLHNNRSISASRDNWLKGSRNFRRIYLSSPKSDYAPSCLFMLGRIYSQMYDKFRLELDLDEAISYYKDTARLFSQDRLADDAYFALGTLFLKQKKDPQKAAEFFSEIVTNYPNGDKHPEAAKRLKILSKENNIPLPEIMVASSRLNNLNYVLPVKYWSSNNYTRVVIMASGPVRYKDVLLEAADGKPRRLYLDFKQSYIEPRFRAPVPIEDGLLRRIRTGQFSTDTVRVVLDIESIGSYKIFSLPDPFRVVIDVRGENLKKDSGLIASDTKPGKNKNIGPGKPHIKHEIVVLRDQKKMAVNQPAVAQQKDEVTITPTTKEFSLAQQLGLGVRTIVIDPGHGGKDPGAMANGIKEKDIVLNIAKQLVPILQKDLGCKVILTRSDDTFISLEERTAIANTQGADLFISLHVNAHPVQKVRGLETYYLNFSTNAEAMRVAARENATSTHQMSELQDILSDIMQNSKINESSRLANRVHQTILTKAKPPNRDYARIKDLGVKQAPFYVLIGAQMPAVLLEIAFISNTEDAANLTNPHFIRMLTHEISEGIKSYVNATSAQLRLK